MLDFDTAQRVAINAATKHNEPHGIFEKGHRRYAGGGLHFDLDKKLPNYFSRKLNGLPPGDAELRATVWMNGHVKEVAS